MILIIDDDFAYTRALELILNEDIPSATFSIFADGSSGIQSVMEGQKPQAVILDMMVPMDANDLKGGRPPATEGELPRGVQVLETLVAAGVDVKRIVVITALIKRELLNKLLELGIPEAHILFKPARVDEISHLLKNIYERKVT